MSEIHAIIFMLTGLLQVEGSCVYNKFDKKSPPVVSVKDLNENFVPIKPSQLSSITIPEGHEISAYCGVGFSSYDHQPILEQKHFKIRCENGKLREISENDSTWNNHQIFSCIQTIYIYRARLSYCEQFSLAFGLDVDRIPLMLSDICFNTNSMEAHLVHYATIETVLSRNGSIVLKYPDLYIYPSDQFSVDFLEANQARTKALEERRQKTLLRPFLFQKYRFDELVPADCLLKGYGVDEELLKIISIPWWTHLKDRNWNLIEKLVDEFTQTRSYDIFTGILRYDEAHPHYNADIKKHLSYSINSLQGEIPLYVWKYVKPKLPTESGNEVIIIGINSPFLTLDDVLRLQFCSDICDRIDWLQSALPWLKLLDFGYVFCCRATAVREQIKSIDKIRYSLRNEFIPPAEPENVHHQI